MDPNYPEAPRELDDLSQPSAAGGQTPTEYTAAHPTHFAGPAAVGAGGSERPKVRFNSKTNLSGLATAGHVEQHPRQPAGARTLRPALHRNTSSPTSTTGDLADEALGPEKLASAAAAALRAHQVAQDAQDDYSNGTFRRWSIASDAMTDKSYSEVPMTSGESPEGTAIEEHGAKLTAQAENLLKAHTCSLQSAMRGDNPSTDAAAGGLGALINTEIYEDHVSSGNGKGGVFYQILQAYRNPNPLGYDGFHDQQTKSSSPGSSGGATPKRQKWYTQEKATKSQDTLSRLIGASAKLANPNSSNSEKSGVSSSSPAYSEMLHKRGQHHKRNSSGGRIMSMMGLAHEDEVKITIHVADILKRQQYLIRMCRALMLFGAPTHRLEEYLAMSAKVLEIDSQFLYIPGCMVISFDDVLTHTTEVRIVRTAQGVNLGKLKDVHEIYKEVLHDVIGLDDALARLDEVINAKELYSVWISVLMYGLASAAVSIFFKARFIDMPVIFMMGSLLGFLQLVVAPMSRTYNTVFEVSAAILLSFISRALASIRGGDLFCFSALTQGSIAMILPGWMVLSSALELQSKAIVPGSIRLVYSIIYSAFLAYGITVGTTLYGAIDNNAVTSTTCQNPLSSYWNFLFVPLYLFFVTFTVQAKLTQMPAMIAIAMVGYTVNFFTSSRFAASASIAYTFGAFAVGVLANLYSRLRHGVAAAVLLPAVYVQVPGSLASSGAITSGLQIAAQLTNTSDPNASQDTQLNTVVFNVAASMIQIAIGITVGLLMSALIVYPFGKRRSGLWTL
ncbi:hypothetical protein F5Y16DRAFT_378521 [Xylariaceae sp. FL0255]|nr:hypothetical protein F5Y16DRAFT_378521 [Xylariaceae sp. FL0255]